MSFIVYNITDGEKIYVGSTTCTIPQRRGQHRVNFKDEHITWKLYTYWRTVGWDKMKFNIIKDGIIDKKELKICEEEQIRLIEKEKCLNTIKAYCPNYEATRSINSGVGEIEKIEMKRKNRRDYYARKKDDPEWIQKERERNNERMKHKRLDPEYKKKDAERRKSKTICECGSEITVDSKSKHIKTKRHQELLQIKLQTSETI